MLSWVFVLAIELVPGFVWHYKPFNMCSIVRVTHGRIVRLYINNSVPKYLDNFKKINLTYNSISVYLNPESSFETMNPH